VRRAGAHHLGPLAEPQGLHRYGHGLAKMKKGDTAGGNADIAAAQKIATNIAADFARYGVP
jgi:hypothetical protein